MGSMNIVYLTSVRIPNEKASGLAIVRQCEAFAKQGHTLTLVRPNRKNTIEEDAFAYYGILEKNFNIVAVPLIHPRPNFGIVGFLLMRFSLMLTTAWFVFLKRNEIDVLYARDQWMLFLPLFFIPCQKIVCEMHTKHTNFVTRYVVKKAGLCVVISNGLKEFYTPFRQKSDIVVEPSGVETQQFENLPSVQFVRESLLLPVDATVYGYIGKYTTMGEEKGVDEIIEAFAKVHEVYHRTHLVMAGLERSEFEIVKKKCESLNLNADSYTIATLDPKEFAKYLHACDVLVMNYPNTEHYKLYMSPSKLFAYMAAGKIIVTSDLPSIREIVDESAVVFVELENVTDLSRAFELTFKDLKVLGSLGVQAKNKVKQYSWENRSLRILDKVQRNIV